MSEDKDVSAAVVRRMFEAADVVRCVFFDEAWTCDRLLSEDEVEVVKRVGLANMPDFPGRIEIVMFLGEDIEAGQLMATRNIIRPKIGKPHLGPLTFAREGGFTSGRFAGMLPVRGRPH
jgi:hypothetical protein